MDISGVSGQQRPGLARCWGRSGRVDVQMVRASYRSPKMNGDPEKKSDGERSRGKKQGPAAAFRSLSLHISVFSQRRDITIRSSFRLGIPLGRTFLLSIVKKRDLVSLPIAQHVGRNHLADHQPAVLLLQAKVCSLASLSLYTLGTPSKPKAKYPQIYTNLSPEPRRSRTSAAASTMSPASATASHAPSPTPAMLRSASTLLSRPSTST